MKRREFILTGTGAAIAGSIFRRQFLRRSGVTLLAPLLSPGTGLSAGAQPDTVFYNGKIVTVNPDFSIAQAVAVQGDRFLAVGSDEDILRLDGRQTRKVNLEGRTVVPGLIEGHAHPEPASLSEADGPLPNPRTVDECLAWIRREAGRKPNGTWITHPKLFQTRLSGLRFPTLKELDAAAPDNPVFLNASYGGIINTAAMRASGISHETAHSGLLRDSATGRLTGKLLRAAFGLLKLPAAKEYTVPERAGALVEMFKRYNRVGFTSVISGGTGPSDDELYRYMKANDMLTVRVCMNKFVRFPFKDRPIREIRDGVAAIGQATGSGDEWVRTGALKTTIDGGILTGTAYLREPWGHRAGELFGVTDPDYRGEVNMTANEFAGLVQAGAEAGWAMTAHCAGGGGVDLMLDAYEKVSRSIDIRPLRCTIIHGNFYTAEAMERAARLNVIAEMQPAWFYKDADAMLDILGGERIRTFHPCRSMLNAGVVISSGSDHMVILDDRESINPYNPWLAMWSMVTRKTERGATITPDEAISREQALRCYTINSAYATFEETLKGSIEPDKLADMVVLDHDLLTCTDDAFRDMTVRMTVVGGKVIYEQ